MRILFHKYTILQERECNVGEENGGEWNEEASGWADDWCHM